MNTNIVQQAMTCFSFLSDWELIKISGADTKKYLQGQITADVLKLPSGKASFAAHCDAKGKVLSPVLLFFSQESAYFLIRKSLIRAQLDALKKYAIFSKVTIDKTGLIAIGMWGQHVKKIVEELEFTIPPSHCSLTEKEGLILIRFNTPELRFLFLLPEENKASFQYDLFNQGATCCLQSEWLKQEILASHPVIDKENSFRFLPQALDLDKIEGISFSKGCYLGQEMIARATYRGINKRSLFCLIGKSSVLPQSGDTLQIALGKFWRDAGSILAVTETDNNRFLIQTVLPKETTSDSLFRLKKSNESQFRIKYKAAPMVRQKDST